MARTRAPEDKQQGQGEESLCGGAMGMWQSSFSQFLTHPCLCQVTRINRAGLQARALKSRHNVWRGQHPHAASILPGPEPCQTQPGNASAHGCMETAPTLQHPLGQSPFPVLGTLIPRDEGFAQLHVACWHLLRAQLPLPGMGSWLFHAS